MKNLVDLDFMWAVGYFEGEGCLGAFKRGRYRQPKMIVTSTDLDTLERFRSIVKCGRIRGVRLHSGLSSKPQWEWESKRQVEIEGLLERMMPYLSQRRKEKGEEIFAYTRRDRTKKYLDEAMNSASYCPASLGEQ